MLGQLDSPIRELLVRLVAFYKRSRSELIQTSNELSGCPIESFFYFAAVRVAHFLNPLKILT